MWLFVPTHPLARRLFHPACLGSWILEKRIGERSAHICIIGLGYVGLPLATEFAEVGYRVTGVDLDRERSSCCNAGESYIGDLPTRASRRSWPPAGCMPPCEYAAIEPAPDAVFICVPTPYTELKVPDISYITAAARDNR